MKPDKKLIIAFDDIISEKEVIAKTGYSKASLQKLRRDGIIKTWGTINGKKIMYSKTELVTLLGFAIGA